MYHVMVSSPTFLSASGTKGPYLRADKAIAVEPRRNSPQRLPFWDDLAIHLVTLLASFHHHSITFRSTHTRHITSGPAI